MDNSVCANCLGDFSGREKGFVRHSLGKKLPNCSVTGLEALSTLTSASFTPIKNARKGNFLCPTCWTSLSGIYRYKQCSTDFWDKTAKSSYIGRKLPERSAVRQDEEPCASTSVESPSCLRILSASVQSPNDKQNNKRNTVATYIRRGQYRRAIKRLYCISPSSRKHVHAFIKRTIRREVKSLLKSKISLGSEATVEAMEGFSWNKTLGQLKDSAPMLMDALTASITTVSNEETLQRGVSKVVNLKPILGTVVGCILHARKPVCFRFLQTLYSIQLWQGGLKRTTIDQLSRTGTCLCYMSTLKAIDNIRQGFDKAAIHCKEKLQEQLAIPQSDGCPDHSLQVTPKEQLSVEVEFMDTSESESCTTHATCTPLCSEVSENESDDKSFSGDELDSTEEQDMEQDEDNKNAPNFDVRPCLPSVSLHPGYTLCWDNVGKKVTTRHPTSTTVNTYINVALGYMTINRVPSTHLDSSSEDLIHAVDIPNNAFVAGEGDFFELRNRMKIIVGRIVTRHLPWFRDNFSQCVVHHLLHEHSVESSRRSILINLGVFDENPSSTQGAVKIYERLQNYIPNVGDQPYPTVVFGDGLSCERGNDAAKARCNGLTPWERLDGMEPAAQEFHKEMILLQDHYDEFYKGSSAAERGTLFNLKNVCNFRTVKGDIGDNVSHAWELMQTVTEALVVLLAMRKMGLETIHSSVHKNILEASVEEKRIFFDNVCEDIVNTVWHDVNTDLLMVESQDGSEAYCCNEDKDDNFIGCDSRYKCLNGEWFHYSCANVDAENLPDEWYCSEMCKTQHLATVTYCYCKRDVGEIPMVGCAAEDRCTQKEWYHMECVGLTVDTVPVGDWFCSTACKDLCVSMSSAKKQKMSKAKVPSKDYKFLYTTAMTWSGLNLLCRRDAVREGDGDAMMSYWLIDLIQFFRKRHVKYVILAHRLMAAVNGWVPENLRQDLRWNRTVNYSGGIGRNLPADLTNEFLNRLFKDLLQKAHGRNTPETLARCSQLIGPFRECLDVVFDQNFTEKAVYRHRRRNTNTDVNVIRVVQLLNKQKLFDVMPGRQHRSFPEFHHDETPGCPAKYLSKMKELSGKLDIKRSVVLNGSN